MEHGAIDLHKKESQVRILTESGEVIDQRIRTTRDRLTALFWRRPRARILIEASTESEWDLSMRTSSVTASGWCSGI